MNPPSPSIKLIQGDCLVEMARIADGSVDAVITDPPYEIGGDVVRGNIRDHTTGRVESMPTWDRLDNSWVMWASRVLKPGGGLVAFTDTKRPGDLWDVCLKSGLRPRQIVYWIKHAPPPNPRRNFQSAVEVAVVASKGPLTFWGGGALTPNVWYGNIEKSPFRLHPAQKPIDLMEWLCELFCPLDGVVCDPYLGSGTTGLAALNRGRNFIGIEKDPGYFAVAQRRIAEAQVSMPLFDGVPA